MGVPWSADAFARVLTAHSLPGLLPRCPDGSVQAAAGPGITDVPGLLIRTTPGIPRRSGSPSCRHGRAGNLAPRLTGEARMAPARLPGAERSRRLNMARPRKIASRPGFT